MEPSHRNGVKEAYTCFVRLFPSHGRKHSNPLCLKLETDSTIRCATVKCEGENASDKASVDHVDLNLINHKETSEETCKESNPILSKPYRSDDSKVLTGTLLRKSRIHRRDGKEQAMNKK